MAGRPTPFCPRRNLRSWWTAPRRPALPSQHEQSDCRKQPMRPSGWRIQPTSGTRAERHLGCTATEEPHSAPGPVGQRFGRFGFLPRVPATRSRSTSRFNARHGESSGLGLPMTTSWAAGCGREPWNSGSSILPSKAALRSFWASFHKELYTRLQEKLPTGPATHDPHAHCALCAGTGPPVQLRR